MQYKLLKKIEQDSLDVWSIIDLWDKEYVCLSYDQMIPITRLLQQWYLEVVEDFFKEKPDTQAIRNLIQDLIDNVKSWEYHEDDDRKDWFYETAIDAFCDESFHEWFKKNS